MCGFHLLLKGMLHLFFYLFMESTAFSSETKLQLPSDAFWLVCADLSRTQQHRLYTALKNFLSLQFTAFYYYIVCLANITFAVA